MCKLAPGNKGAGTPLATAPSIDNMLTMPTYCDSLPALCPGIPPILTSPEQVKQEITITLCFRAVMMDNRDYQCL